MKYLYYFMQVYMYELEKFLTSKNEELKSVSFQSDEANTDRPLKEYVKSVIESEFTTIPSDISISSLINDDGTKFDISNLSDYRIEKVLLPEDVTDEIKAILSSRKKAVYTNPDLCLKITDGLDIVYETVELKSTKQNSIPGSSIQQILPDEWVIFIKHTSNSIKVVTGQYIHAINSKMQFPDRSPRPQVSIEELKEWNHQNRIIENDCISYKADDSDVVKFDLIMDWQDVLSKRWIEVLFEHTSVKTNEPWFNNNLRKFIIRFLDKYDKLNDSEKQSLKTQIQSLIQE